MSGAKPRKKGVHINIVHIKIVHIEKYKQRKNRKKASLRRWREK